MGILKEWRRSPRQTTIWVLLGLGLFVVGFRFWGLERFNTFVFDEVYYVKFANNYLTRTPFFDGHPPLSKYLIAIGIWLGSHFPGDAIAVKNGLAGSLLSPWSYRWLNAVVGSCLPFIGMGIAYQLSRRRSFAFLVGLLMALDGLLLVESRYALNNVYLLLFGLLGQWFWLIGLTQERWRRWLWLGAAGVAFGCSASIKWNGLWFLLGAYGMWAIALGWRLLKAWRRQETPEEPRTAWWRSLGKLPILPGLLCLAVIPVAVYSVIWIPHLQLDRTFGFWEVQKQILQYHQHVGGNVPSVHPYCSAWYTWPWMLRPVVYLFETAQSLSDPVPMKPDLPWTSARVVYDVHAMGNPALWWLSTAAIFGVVAVLGERVIRAWAMPAPEVVPAAESGLADSSNPSLTKTLQRQWQETWILIYLLVNYLANYGPWMKVTRCTFLYHYMEAGVFATIALAWWLDQSLRSYQPWRRLVAVTLIFLIMLAFVFWLPLFLGLPLSPQAVQWRRWLPGW